MAFLALALAPFGALGHGALYEPPPRNSQGMGLLAPSCAGGACQWYSQGTSIGCPAISGSHDAAPDCPDPAEPTLRFGQDDDLLQYPDDGYGHPTTYHPWRYPGSAPVGDVCGITGGASPPLGQLDPPPGFASGAAGSELPKLLEKTVWRAGSDVEVAWGLAANHGGGYQYRLCRADKEISEECFQQTPLGFVGDKQWLQFGQGFDRNDRIEITARRVGGDKVVPKHSTWTMNPIPGCKGTAARARTPCSGPTFQPPASDRFWKYGGGKEKGIYGYGGGHCMGNLSVNPDAKCSLEEYGSASFDFGIVDLVHVPKDLPEGEYVLSWRWDCEMTKQIWSSCADVTITKNEPTSVAFTPLSGCTACCEGICSQCSDCLEDKSGSCAQCWQPLRWWSGRDWWTPRAKPIQCLGHEGPGGGPGEYLAGDPLSPPWSPGCSRCWAEGCEVRVRGTAAAAPSWPLLTKLLLAGGAVLLAGGLLISYMRRAPAESARELERAPPSTELSPCSL
ncbi:unnamed protein product [Effrenium voratum]|uniref:Chitin-binding type-4 domain-containing protein n=1 Tax=Effrenium voratum TaxID=2562239 RepID=A0AA36MT33_9DINO|nr:unnamed protein product [Effrenium voratum]